MLSCQNDALNKNVHIDAQFIVLYIDGLVQERRNSIVTSFLHWPIDINFSSKICS